MTAATVTRIDTELSLAFLRCRTYRHAWDEFFPDDMYPPVYGWRLSLRCTRCGSERHDLNDFKGKVMSRRYIYVEGYLQRGVPQTMFREALFERLRTKLAQVSAIGEASSPPRKKAGARK